MQTKVFIKFQMVDSDYRIPAIKFLRDMTGLGLTEAKDAVYEGFYLDVESVGSFYDAINAYRRSVVRKAEEQGDVDTQVSTIRALQMLELQQWRILAGCPLDLSNKFVTC